MRYQSELVALVALVAVACSPSRRGDDDKPCEPTSCDVAGRNCGQLDDGCGTVLDCGACGEGEVCGGGGTGNVCGSGTCEPESDDAICARLEADCGAPLATDNCGTVRRVGSCGACAEPFTCGGGGEAHRCGGHDPNCVAESDDDFCARLETSCGTVTARDNCGDERTVESCGTCAEPTTCGGGGIEGRCGRPGVCTPESDRAFCTRHEKNCGTVTAFDNCDASRTVSCGSCTLPQGCGGAGTENVCGCSSNETTAELCELAGNKDCGQLQVRDACNVLRTVSCGTCSAPKTCGGAGTQNLCGCSTRETDAAFCARVGAECGEVEGTDTCGDPRVVSCGGCSGGKSCGGAGIPGRCGGFLDVPITSGCTDDIQQIWGSGPNDVWVNCGNFGNGLHRWNGSWWTQMSSAYNELLTGSGFDNVWAVSSSADLARWNGATWTYISGPPLTVQEYVLAVATTGPTTGWVTTTAGRIYKLTAVSTGIYATGTWVEQANPAAPHLLYGLWARTPSELFAVGQGGTILKGNGTTWTTMSSPTTLDLHAVHGRSGTAVFAGGDGHVVVRFDGTRWTLDRPAHMDGTTALWATTTDVWVTGRYTSFLRRVGNEWFDGWLPRENMGSIWASSPTDVWIGGMQYSAETSPRLYRMIP